MRYTKSLGAAVASVFLVSLASADTIPVNNPGFEAFVLADGQRSKTGPSGASSTVILSADPVPGWFVDVPDGDGGTQNPTAAVFPAEAPGGQNVGYSVGPLLSQQIVAAVQPNTEYLLSVLVGRPLAWTQPFEYFVALATPGDGPGGSFVRALDTNSVSVAPGTFSLVTVAWESPADFPANTPLSIFLGSKLGPAAFDEVSVTTTNTTPFPEPASLALFGVTIPMISRRRR